MTTLEILQAARAKIVQGWCQRALARDANGVRLFGGHQTPDGEEGVPASWCALGAIDGYYDAEQLFKQAAGIPHSMPIGFWNDSPERTQADVLAAFDRAIEACS